MNFEGKEKKKRIKQTQKKKDEYKLLLAPESQLTQTAADVQTGAGGKCH